MTTVTCGPSSGVMLATLPTIRDPRRFGRLLGGRCSSGTIAASNGDRVVTPGSRQMIAIYIVIAVVALLVIAVIVSYNRFVRQRNLVQESWRQIDVELNRRHDLIPNLVETVRGYAAHERGVFEAVTPARGAAQQTMQSSSAGAPPPRHAGGVFGGSACRP